MRVGLCECLPLLKVCRALLGIYMAVSCIEGIRALLSETFSRVWRFLFRVWGAYDS